jgi:catalase
MAVPKPMKRVLEKPSEPEVEVSPALSLFTLPGDGRIATRRIAILIADGVEAGDLQEISEGLAGRGAVVRLVGARLGSIHTSDGDELEVDATLESTPSVLYDAVVVPAGKAAAGTLGALGQALEFLKDQYRHCKPMLVLGEGRDLLEDADIPMELPSGEPDPGLIVCAGGLKKDTLAKFVAAIARHRHFDRALDPPTV